MENILLNDGVSIPQIGFGVFLIPNDGSTYNAVREALKVGYTHIDTAAAYFNEEEVGKAIKDSGIPREKLFITSKLWLQDYSYDKAKIGIERSLRHLDTYIDLYLIHQPYGDVVGAWKRMEEYKKEGKIRSIGVSNMTPKIWQNFVPSFDLLPSVNQIEFNPLTQQKAIRTIMDQSNVKVEAWYPLGHGNKDLINHPIIEKLAKKYQKNQGQIILRFEIQDGVITLPKSTNPKNIKGNLEIFDFSLTAEEMEEIYSLDLGKASHDPDAEGVAERLLNAFVIKD